MTQKREERRRAVIEQALRIPKPPEYKKEKERPERKVVPKKER